MKYNNWIEAAIDQLRELIVISIKTCQQDNLLSMETIPAFTVEIPGDTSHGDFAANIAMVGAKTFRLAPVKIAEIILDNINLKDSFFNSAEIAGPGFLNFFLKPNWFTGALDTIVKMGKDWGKTNYGNNEKVMVEFVSANPTGPMHLGNARGAVIGDSLVSAMNAAGYNAYREFYLNDAGNQIEKFKLSLEIRYLQQLKGADFIELPEDAYQGEDITLRAKEYIALYGEKLIDMPSENRQQALCDFALPLNIQAMKDTLEKYRVVYDTWFHESTLYKDGSVVKIIELLKEKDLCYESEGATWYKATAFGEEKDEVLIRNNGNYTYFAADIAYHYNKFAIRNFSKVINVWGADHHGHIARMKNAMDAVGLDGNKLDIILIQLVRLMKNGEPYRMSKRSGQSVTLDDLLELVPVDAARFFFNARESTSAMDFDLDLAVEQSSKNPVFYVQYAHARIYRIFENATVKGSQPRIVTPDELLLLNHPSEIALIRKLANLPNIIINAAVRYETAPITHYAVDIANSFHKFYDDCRVLLEDKSEEPLLQARLTLCDATRITIANILDILKINAPEIM